MTGPNARGHRGWISLQQLERDHRGLRNSCAACGHEGTTKNPLEVNEDGYRVHSKAFHDRMHYRGLARTELREMARYSTAWDGREHDTTTSVGGTGMTVGDIRGAVAQASQDRAEILGTTQQTVEALNRLHGMLAEAFAGSEQSEAIDTLAALGQAQELFWQACDLIRSGINAAESYAGRL